MDGALRKAPMMAGAGQAGGRADRTINSANDTRHYNSGKAQTDDRASFTVSSSLRILQK